MPRARLNLLTPCLALALLMTAAPALPQPGTPPPPPAYAAEVEAFRARHEAAYTREYVPLEGLFFLEPGAATVGSSASSRVRLPERAPASIGILTYEPGTGGGPGPGGTGGRVTFEPRAGAPVTLDGAPVTKPVELRPAGSGTPAGQIAIGDITFWVHLSGPRLAIRLRDPQGDQARSFAGFRWFPVDPSYRIVARFIRDAEPRQLQIPSLIGDLETFTTEGIVEFELRGQRVRMRPMTTRPGRLYFVFRDATAGKETYEAARFLYADLGDDGTAVLDFNMACNPPCAFNPYTTCPLPLPENRLSISIRAGEMAYPHPPALP